MDIYDAIRTRRSVRAYPNGDAFTEPGRRIAMDEFIRWERWS